MTNPNNRNGKYHALRIYCFIIILTLLGNQNVQAQNYLNTGNKKPMIYSEVYGGISSEVFAGFGQNIILSNQWGLYIGYENGYQKSKSQPTDYFGIEQEEVAILNSFSSIPTDRYAQTSLRISRLFTEKTAIVRFKAELGITSLKYENVHFKPTGKHFPAGSNWFESWPANQEYKVSYTKDQSIGLSARLVAEFAFTRVFGLQVAFMGTVSKQHTFIGLETGFTFGRVRDKLH